MNFEGSCGLAVHSANYPNCEADIKDRSDCTETFLTVLSANTPPTEVRACGQVQHYKRIDDAKICSRGRRVFFLLLK